MPTAAQLANVVISGTLTGTVYGLMALGLSAIFGVIRLVNFAHGELMTLAMYAAVVAFQGLALDPFLTMVVAAALFAGLGYLLQRAFINRFVHRPEHMQMLLMIGLSIIIANLLLIGFGPDARSVQTSYQLDSFELGPILVDKVRVYAAGAAVVATAALAAFFRFTLTGKAIRACADNPLGPAWRACLSRIFTPSRSGSAPPASPWPGARPCRSSTSPRPSVRPTRCSRS